jgi:hypothetical protein
MVPMRPGGGASCFSRRLSAGPNPSAVTTAPAETGAMSRGDGRETYFSILLWTCQNRRVRWAVSVDNLP